MTYSEKLRNPLWQKMRLEILQRDNFTCKFCGSGLNDGKNLQVHHILYKRRDPWDYPEYLYQTLCDSCHSERQHLTDKSVDAVRIAVANVPTPRLIAVVTKLCSEAMLEIEVDK
jgi:5-methylcytosine-specific restriction endonuclease McrA